MGTSRSPAELSGKLSRLAADYQDFPHAVVSEASLATKQAIKAIAPARLRGVGRSGRALDVGYNVIGRGTESQSLVYARGPWQLIERDTAAHQIPKARGARARRRYVVFGGNVFSRANHPGTHGQHPWRRGVQASRPIVSALFASKATLTIRRIF